MMVGGAVINALAFSGSNFMFSQLGHGDADAERKRHDLAVEQLNAAQAAWSKKRTERLDFLNEELRRQGHALQTFRDVDEAAAEYHRVTGGQLDSLGSEPTLSDFYVPDEAQKNREIAFIVVGLAVTGVVAYKLL
jgi:hypothetical protein